MILRWDTMDPLKKSATKIRLEGVPSRDIQLADVRNISHPASLWARKLFE